MLYLYISYEDKVKFLKKTIQYFSKTLTTMKKPTVVGYYPSYGRTKIEN